MLKLDGVYNDSICWQMSKSERASIFFLINQLKRKKNAIEIGSYCGGLLNNLSKEFENVYSVDIDHSLIENKEGLKNIEYILGDSKETLPKLISDINLKEKEINFILIDGDHEYETVYQDIQNILNIKPQGDLILLLHDSWYSGVRQAINDTNWESNPYISYIDTDFCTGDLMWSDYRNEYLYVGGLALIIMSDSKRKGILEIRHTQDYMYNKVNEFINRLK